MRPEARHVPAVLILLLAVAVSGTGCPGGGRSGRASAGPPAAGPNAFAANALWDDGRAEIDAYEASVRRYGIPRTLTAYLIVVKEDLSKKQLVKADPGHPPATHDPGDLFPVLKLNHVIDYQTGIYTYHQMVSGFFDRATMDLVKFSLTSNEWCGNTYKEYTRRNGRGALHVHTYWHNQAEATYDVPAGPDVVFYDGLPVWIRSLPQTPGTARPLRLVPAQMDSKGAKPEIRPATLRAQSEELVIVPAGGFRTLRWELRAGDGRPDFFWTSRDYPHVLVAWDRPDGSGYRLKWTQRLAYWNLNRPGDEKHLEGPVPADARIRSPVPSPDPGAPRRSRRGTPGRRGGRSRRGGRPR